MERIFRVGAVLTITILTCLLTIIIANGELTWATAGLVLMIALIIGLAVGTWTVVHNQFPQTAEVGITIGIVVGVIVMFILLLMGGSEIKQACKDLFGDGSAWWLLAPAAGTTAIVLLFGMHKERV